MERRREEAALGGIISDLNKTVGDLKVTVGELKITVGNMTQRDVEDRQDAKDVSKDVDDLKLWRSRIRGQLAVLWLILAALVSALIARATNLIP